MSKYIFPAVFTKEDGQLYSVQFPDIEGCFTSGEGLLETFEMAEDALALVLYDMEAEGKQVPEPTKIEAIRIPKGAFTSYVTCDTKVYRRNRKMRAVKKTLTIPEWMNEEAVAAGLNFSKILQDALFEKLETAPVEASTNTAR